MKPKNLRRVLLIVLLIIVVGIVLIFTIAFVYGLISAIIYPMY